MQISFAMLLFSDQISGRGKSFQGGAPPAPPPVEESQKKMRVLQMFKLEIKDEAEAEALISQNLTCHIAGIIYKVEELRSPILVQQYWNCQNFGHSAKTCLSKTKCLIVCGESHYHKGCPNREIKQPKCANCKGPYVASYKGCSSYRKQASGQHVVDNETW